MKTVYCENFLTSLKASNFPKGSSVTLGNFDGCHLAHQDILKLTIKEARSRKGLSVAISFAPHPRDYFSQSKAKERLFTLEQKLEAFRAIGLDLAIIQKFDKDFLGISHEDFYNIGLKKNLNTKAITIGENFCFGNERKGTAGWLKKEAVSHGITVNAIDIKSKKGLPINSTQIRQFLEEGQVELAKEFLGKPFSLMGTIKKGDQIGRTLGFPTANFDDISQIIPSRGVYSGFFEILGTKKKSLAIMNIGKRPTLNSKENKLSVEAHCLENQAEYMNLYGKKCLFHFHHKIREEIKFASKNDLIVQIKKDVLETKAWHEKETRHKT